MLAETQKTPVRIVDRPTEPTVADPARTGRSTSPSCIVLSLGLGLGLVCFLEHIDHSVKVPEHLTAGLALPLFGVVPRIRRTARNHRGGHLWTPGHARLDRGRRLPEPPGQPARGDRRDAGRSSPCWSPAPRRARARARPP